MSSIITHYIIRYPESHINIHSAPTTYSGSNSLPEGDDERFSYLKSDNCDELNEHCPLSLLNISQYTDD